MKRFLIILVCLLGFTHLFANPVTADQARTKADKFLNARIATKARTRNPYSTELQMASVGEDDSYYIFNVGQGNGFIIVSGEDATEEILGYSDEGHISPEDMAPAMKLWMKSYTNHINYLRESGAKASTRSSFSKKFQLQDARVARYDQSEPYNIKCPIVDKGFLGFGKDVALTGCVATAMVQLMYYHVWPLEVIRPIPGYVSRKNGLTVNPVGKGTRLNWPNTLRYYNYNNQTMWDYIFGTDTPKPTEEQENTIADIMLYAGTAVNMDYDDVVSLAGVPSVPYAMQEYFGYQEGAFFAPKSVYKIDNWLNAIYTELTENGPVIYCAQDKDSNGHAFLCEGIDHDMLYINWGWNDKSSYANGWYWVTPSTDEQKEKMGYYENQAAIFNLKPDKDRIFTIKSDVTHGRGYVYCLQYHIVWCTKYRKKVIVGNIESDVKEHLYRTAEDLDIKILAMETMPDHIHMLIECKPQCRISDAIKVFKGNTATWLFLTHPEIKTKLWGGHLWNPSYFVATVSERTKEQITNYISSQKEK